MKAPPQPVEINVHTPPPDPTAAARLYGDLERIAEKRIKDAALETFGAKNELRVLKWATSYEMQTLKEHVYVRFTLNGYTTELKVSSDYSLREEQMAGHLGRVLAELLQQELLKQWRL